MKGMEYDFQLVQHGDEVKISFRKICCTFELGAQPALPAQHNVFYLVSILNGMAKGEEVTPLVIT